MCEMDQSHDPHMTCAPPPQWGHLTFRWGSMTWPSQQDLTSFDTGLGVGQGEGEGQRSLACRPLQVSHLTSSSTLVVGQARWGLPHTQQWSGCLRSGGGVWRRAAG